MALEAGSQGGETSLGYHSKAVDGTEVVYGRDNMAAQLRVMCSVTLEIADEEFRPDATKSGMLKRKATSQNVVSVDPSGDFIANELAFRLIRLLTHLETRHMSGAMILPLKNCFHQARKARTSLNLSTMPWNQPLIQSLEDGAHW